jgi:hypothetical protein
MIEMRVFNLKAQDYELCSLLLVNLCVDEQMNISYHRHKSEMAMRKNIILEVVE